MTTRISRSAGPIHLIVALAMLAFGADGVFGQSTSESAPRVAQWIKKLDAASEIERESAVDALTEMGVAAVPALIEVVRTGSMRSRGLAARTLGDMGPAARDAVGALGTLLTDKENGDLAAAAALANLGADALPVLRAALKDNRPAVRKAVVRVFDTLRDGDKATVVALGDLLQDEDPGIRHDAMVALARLGVQAKPAAPQLRKALADADFNVQSWAFEILAILRDDFAADARKALAAHKETRVRVAIASNMVRHGVDVDVAETVLKAGLSEKDKMTVVLAQSGLGDLAQKRRIPLLITDLKNGPQAAQESLRTLSSMGWTAKSAAPAVAKLLDDNLANGKADQFGEPRTTLVAALRNIGGDSAVVVPVLAKVLDKDNHLTLRINTVDALANHDELAIPVLLSVIKDKQHQDIRKTSLRSLSNLMDLNSGGFKNVVPLLTPVMKEKEADLRQAAIEVLARCGRPALGVLIDALKDKDAKVRELATKALGDHPLDSKMQALLLEVALKDAGVGPRFEAIHSLVRQGNKGVRLLARQAEHGKNWDLWGPFLSALQTYRVRPPAALPFLLMAVKEPENHIRGRAAGALANYGEAAKDAVPDLARVLAGDGFARHHAIEALCAVGPEGQAVMAGSLMGADASLRTTILTELKKHGCRAKAAVGSITACLEDKAAQVRSLSAEVLGGMGADARAALPALDIALDDPDPTVRMHVQNAMRHIKN